MIYGENCFQNSVLFYSFSSGHFFLFNVPIYSLYSVLWAGDWQVQWLFRKEYCCEQKKNSRIDPSAVIPVMTQEPCDVAVSSRAAEPCYGPTIRAQASGSLRWYFPCPGCLGFGGGPCGQALVKQFPMRAGLLKENRALWAYFKVGGFPFPLGRSRGLLSHLHSGTW